MRTKSFSRKGFFFTVLALVLVSFMFISVQLWAQDQQVAEQRQAERFRLQALQTSLALINNDSLNHFANASMIYALNNLSNALQEHPDGAALPCSTGPKDLSGNCNSLGTAGPYPDGTYLINASVYELMTGGTTSGHIFPANTGGNCPAAGCTFYSTVHGINQNLTYSPAERKYELANYFNQTTHAAALLGYNLTWGPVENFTFNQTGSWMMGLNFSVNATLSDRGGTVNITRHLDARVVLPIDGLTDPMILHNDMSYRAYLGQGAFGLRPHRNVYHVAASDGGYDTTADASAINFLNHTVPSGGGPHTVEGLGWFFGPVTDQPNSSFKSTDPILNISQINSFIYKTNSQADAITQSAYFGAIILEGAPDPPQYNSSGTYVVGNCNYTVHIQLHCIDCVQYETVNDTKNCPAGKADTISNDSIPINPEIPWATIAGGNGNLPATNHPNFRLGLEEVLISSHNTAFTQDRGGLFDPLSSPNYNHDHAIILSSKSADDAQSNTTIWDLTGPRDIALCGYYVKSLYGPSYLQRYTALPAYRSGTPYSKIGQGIESFVVGQWAGGAQDKNAQGTAPDYDETRSRVDYLFYQQPQDDNIACSGLFDKGLPGCKSYPMCTATDAAPATTSPRGTSVGRFTLTLGGDALPVGPTERYNLLLVTRANALVQTCK